MYDFIVIGAGSGGLSVAINARKKNLKVLLIEKNLPGGECTWSGCIPSKVLINIAKDIHNARKLSSFEVDKDYPLKKVRQVIKDVYSNETPEILEELGIDYVQGTAHFKNDSTVIANNVEYTAKNIVISTGSKPAVPGISGVKSVNYMTNDSIFQMKELPKSITIIGAGTIGIELSQALNRLDVHVNVIDLGETILIREDKDATKIIHETLIKEGVQFFLNSNIEMITQTPNGIQIKLISNDIPTTIESEVLLFATGRKPNIKDLQLENIGLSDNTFIETNDFLETSVNGVYAIGDSSKGPQFSHVANYQANLIVNNIENKIIKKNYNSLSWCTFTSPELSTLGDIHNINENSIVLEYNENHLDRLKTNPGEKFYMKVICDKKGFLTGATIVGERAGEMICQLQSLMSNNLSLLNLNKMIHPYPTYNEIFRKLGSQIKTLV